MRTQWFWTMASSYEGRSPSISCIRTRRTQTILEKENQGESRIRCLWQSGNHRFSLQNILSYSNGSLEKPCLEDLLSLLLKATVDCLAMSAGNIRAHPALEVGFPASMERKSYPWDTPYSRQIHCARIEHPHPRLLPNRPRPFPFEFLFLILRALKFA